MKKILHIAILLVSGLGFCQDINDYQYVVIPRKFEFFKEENKYNLNSLTKMVFEKQGFTVYYDDDHKPDELAMDRCKALYGDLVSNSNMLSTVLSITLKDCQGKVLFTSEKGKSKEKDFRKGYYEALREASQSLAGLGYQYNGKNGGTIAAAAKPATPVVQQAPQTSVSQPVTVAPANNGAQLFAQPIANGYQLVDTTPKVVLKIYKTSQQDSYTAVSDSRNGVVFKKGNDWFFEYYQDDKLVSEKLNIKF